MKPSRTDIKVFFALQQDVRIYGTNYSRMDQIKFVEDSL